MQVNSRNIENIIVFMHLWKLPVKNVIYLEGVWTILIILI